MKRAEVTSRRGRPREFDANRALDRALEVFWRKGYEGASLSDLTEAMGISRPSLYSAFGDKEKLFRLALDRYAKGPAGYVARAMAAPTARQAMENLLTSAAKFLADPRHPGGCLAVSGALACGDTADSIRRELIARRAQGEALIRQRLERAREEGDLPADADPSDLARYVTSVMHGMSVQASGGVSEDNLLRVARFAMRAWPSGK